MWRNKLDHNNHEKKNSIKKHKLYKNIDYYGEVKLT